MRNTATWMQGLAYALLALAIAAAALAFATLRVLDTAGIPGCGVAHRWTSPHPLHNDQTVRPALSMSCSAPTASADARGELRKRAPSPGATRHPLPVGEGNTGKPGATRCKAHNILANARPRSPAHDRPAADHRCAPAPRRTTPT